eukprot:8873287-Pyramimonas_sp.AAC.1
MHLRSRARAIPPSFCANLPLCAQLCPLALRSLPPAPAPASIRSLHTRVSASVPANECANVCANELANERVCE